MKRNLLFIIFLLIGIGMTGQISVDSDSYTLAGTPEDEDIKLEFEITNTGSEAIRFHWEIIRTDVPEEWEFYVCDSNLCYDWGQEKSPSIYTLEYPAGATEKFRLHMRPNGVMYDGITDIRFYSDEDASITVGGVSVFHEISTSSTFESKIADITLFPNPTSEYFKVKNDNEVYEVAIYNLLAKRLKSFKHNDNKLYNIADLSKGLYIVRLFDKKGNSIRALRLTKK